MPSDNGREADPLNLDALRDDVADCERRVIAGLLGEPRRLDDVARTVRFEDFSDALCRTTFRVLSELVRAGKAADLATVAHLVHHADAVLFQDARHLAATFAALWERRAASAHVEHYAREVRRHATYRRLHHAGARIAHLGGKGASGDLTADLAAAGEALAAVEQDAGQRGAVDLADALHECMDEINARLDAGRPDTVPTGLDELDGMLGGGLRGGHLVLVAARPGVGKTSLALALALAGASAGFRALFCSLEQDRLELCERLLAGELRVDSRAIRSPHISGQLLGDLLDARRGLADRVGRLLCFDDAPRQSAAAVAAQARRERRKGGLGLVVVDYLGLLEVRATGGRKRYEMVGDLSRDMKALARALKVPVVLLAQLNREIEGRGASARPRLSDLRESGSLEQDADAVLFLSRDEKQPHVNPGAPPHPHAWVNLDLAKQRNGPVGSVPLVFDRPSTTFTVAPMSDPRRKS